MPVLWSTLAALVMVTAVPAVPVPAAPDVVSVASDADQRLTVAVNIGTQGPFRFLVDTGAQNTVLADGVVGRLGMAPSSRRPVTGVAGTLLVETVSLDDIHVGKRIFSEPVVPLLRTDVIRADGILGIDALQGQRVLLDFEHNLLSIGDGRDDHEADGNEIVVTAHRRQGQLIVTHARIDGIDTDVVIDTGTETSIGNLALRHRLTHYSAFGATRLIGVTGQEIDAELSTTGTLSVDHLTLANMQIAFVDSPAFVALHLDRRPALLLGMRELRAMRRVVIDFAHRRVTFNVAN